MNMCPCVVHEIWNILKLSYVMRYTKTRRMVRDVIMRKTGNSSKLIFSSKITYWFHYNVSCYNCLSTMGF